MHQTPRRYPSPKKATRATSKGAIGCGVAVMLTFGVLVGCQADVPPPESVTPFHHTARGGAARQPREAKHYGQRYGHR